ncbi:D-aminopeptidase [Roseomonas alba]|nr:D-aminopeptidase [Neoroseomonas alba]
MTFAPHPAWGKTVLMTDTPIERIARGLPLAYPGPGGAVAVLRDGEVLLRHAWGYANAEQRIPFTPRTLFRICSITKQFVCATLLDRLDDPCALDGDLRAYLPLLDGKLPSTLHLAHNQSGLRDYWAVAMLHGSPAEAPFGPEESRRVIAGARSLHFAPGSRYSYVNHNFRLIGEMLEARTGRSLAELLRDGVFDRAGMHSAILAADTRAMPDGTEGYEGTQVSGFRPAVNRIHWTGDAGIGASLDDMIAWEKHIDATRDDPGSLYRRLSAPVAFADGMPAHYGFGLARSMELGRAATGHGGGLRGWTSRRLHLAAERISIVVLFNHISDPSSAALDLLAALLDEPRSTAPEDLPPPSWCGAYVDPETGLSVRIDPVSPGRLRLRFGQSGETLALQSDGDAVNAQTRLVPTPEGLRMERVKDNQVSMLRPADGSPRLDAEGRYRCAELDAELTIVDAGGALYGAFSGFLGRGRMELLDPIGTDLWALPCPRALDHTPPGDWTIAIHRDGAGRATAATVGCWLARGLRYDRV